jgi:hypothetical protein
MNRRQPWVKHIRTAATCMLLGVVLTVCVAWGFASTGPNQISFFSAINPDLEQQPLEARTGLQITGRLPNGFGGPGPLVVTVKAGLPMHAAKHEGSVTFYVSDPAPGFLGGIRRPYSDDLWRPTRLPVVPLFPGFAIDVLFWGFVSWLLAFAPFTIRRTIRTRRNRCPTCAYDLTHLTTCPECGPHP